MYILLQSTVSSTIFLVIYLCAILLVKNIIFNKNHFSYGMYIEILNIPLEIYYPASQGKS